MTRVKLQTNFSVDTEIRYCCKVNVERQ